MDKVKVIKYIEFLIGETNKYIYKAGLVSDDLRIVANEFNRFKYESMNSEKLSREIKSEMVNIEFDVDKIEKEILNEIKKKSFYSRIIPYYVHYFRLKKPEYEDRYVRGVLDNYRTIFNSMLIAIHESN